MRRMSGVIALALAAALATSGCYGPFQLTKNLYNWNGKVGSKWANEAAFIVLAWVPIYALTTLGDALIFNSIEFWGGTSPVKPSADGTRTRTKRIARRDAEAVLTRTAGIEGEQFLVEQYQHGRPAGALRIRQVGDVTVGANASGATLFTARTLEDGSIVISDAAGREIARHSAAEIQQLASARQ